jgi:mannose-1-phosphate guanylyltransferase
MLASGRDDPMEPLKEDAMSRESLDAGGHVWAIVLVGGQGGRLRPLIHRVHKDDRPKPFAALLGSRCLLRQTLDRIRLMIPAARTVIVIREEHERYLAEAANGAPMGRVLVEPADRGTAAEVLLAALWVHRQDPDAMLAVFPSDHFVPEDHGFMRHVADMVEVVKEHPKWIALVAATPADADPDHGWLQPGEVIGWSPAGNPVRRVRQFWENPPALAAQTCLETGWLLNTSMFVATAAPLLEMARRHLPSLANRLAPASVQLDTEAGHAALREAYTWTEREDFFRVFLKRCPLRFAVSRLPALWSDWGTLERVITSLRRAGLLPSWFRESELRDDIPLSRAHQHHI